jgi:hypothetical protein
MPKKGERGIGTGPRPHTWVTGTDPKTHAQYRAFVQCRNQAQWRGEIWQITFEQYQLLWQHKWVNRGRSSDQYCITRADMSLPWNMSNALVITRRQHGQRKLGTRALLGETAASVILTAA